MHDILTHGDCLDVLGDMPGNSVDSIVTDPPYGIKFMGKTWDYDVPSPAIWKECLRVLKPGGQLLSFAGSRTQHRMAARIEDAGFEIRDMIVFLYETSNAAQALIESLSPDQLKLLDAAFGRDGMLGWVYGSGFPKSHHALKPALEPITLARKPCKGSLASNVGVYGTGALNISECRIALAEGEPPYDYPNGPGGSEPNHMWRGRSKGDGSIARQGNPDGRWPANVIHDGSDAVLAMFPYTPQQVEINSASRFFYCAKASKKDRDEGNNHMCVKPSELMRYLCRLVTPPGGTVLDPFMGSGSTGKAAAMEGFSFVGIEREADYVEIARRRIAAARSTTTHSGDAGKHIDN
ncbi:site-specific DNA-methyltransferase [Yersinia canariae]|uniref:Methyltransferase n=1 Tax=Yersinia canariae TaxID=2607663 RepID=A0A857F064_9GAMM|nr:site-specific DNA-methyltransferase [Yersinia canariae]QHB33086.1 site-specific DNA-methyltransferase [Yersinia canariae]